MTRQNFYCVSPLALLLVVATGVIGVAQDDRRSPSETEEKRIVVTLTRGADIGQSFGTLFEAASDDGELRFGAGFQNTYNTRYRGDRHAVQFFVRPTDGKREFHRELLPRPTNDLCGAYLFSKDDAILSTFGGLKIWDAAARSWRSEPGAGGTHESMRLGNANLVFGDSTVSYDGRTILEPPEVGSYQLFFYANGYLCFYHVHRGDKPYRPYENDEDGFSRLYACPWTPTQPRVNLRDAMTLRLPIVGETTFAWGQLGRQIVTGSNIGGFYVFENENWRMILQPQLGRSYQLYSTIAFHDRLLMGQYPTGRVFEYDGVKITDLAGWPPVPEGVSHSAREAQTTVAYGGDLLVGVWPWGEIWRYNPDSQHWSFVQRMFDHPPLSNRVVHPYDVENQGHPVGNLWGQRVTSLAISGPDLFVGTSAKSPFSWDAAKFPFLAPDKWKSYGSVYRLTTPGHLQAPVLWSEGPTQLEFVIRGAEISIRQDARLLAKSTLSGNAGERLAKVKFLKEEVWSKGLYGDYGGRSMKGVLLNPTN